MFRAYAIDLNEISPLIKNEPAQSIYNKAKTENIKETLKKILSAETPFLDSATTFSGRSPNIEKFLHTLAILYAFPNNSYGDNACGQITKIHYSHYE